MKISTPYLYYRNPMESKQFRGAKKMFYLVNSCNITQSILTKIYCIVVYWRYNKNVKHTIVDLRFLLVLTAYYKQNTLKYDTQYDICNDYLRSFYHEQMCFVFVIKKHIRILRAFLSSSLITSCDCSYNASREITLIRSCVVNINIKLFLKYIHKCA